MLTPPPIQLANLGMADSIILMVLALVVFGPRRLPQIGRQIGKLMFEFRKASNDFKFQMEEELRAAEEADRRAKEEAERQRAAALAAASQSSVSAPMQTVESTADIGAVEPPAASSYPQQYPAEAPSATLEPIEAAPVIQPPQTGEQVSASPRPDYYFQSSSDQSTDAAMTEVNPEADVAANAEEFAAGGSSGNDPKAAGEPVPTSEGAPPTPPDHPSEQDLALGTPSDHPSDQDLSLGTLKEPVSQHG
jgi:sec-independent protein translocase protein TatB